jgi:hypothetical protein
MPPPKVTARLSNRKNIKKASEAYHQGQFKSIRKAAEAYNVPNTTLVT